MPGLAPENHLLQKDDQKKELKILYIVTESIVSFQVGWMMTCLGKWLPTLLLLYKCCFSLCDECVCTYLHVWICLRTAPAAQETTANVSYDERTDLHPTLAQQCPKALDSWCKAHSKFLVGALSRVTLYWKIRLWDTSYHKWLCLMICAGKGALDRE